MDLQLISYGSIALIVIVMLILKWKFMSKSPDFGNEESILKEIETYQAHGRQRQAINLLEQAVASQPESKIYRDKLTELRE